MQEASPSTTSSSLLRFGVFELDLRAGELRRGGVKIKLQEKPFQLLATLLERPGEVVTREELRERLWPADTFVVFDDNLNTAIKRLRDALGDSAENPHFVETLPRHGYRFIYPVEAAPTPPSVIPNKREGSALSPLRLARPAALMALGLAALLAVAYIVNLGGLRERLFSRTAPPKIDSIAVLPLANLSGDPEQDYFVEGMHEALTTELSQISQLKVISRASAMRYKGTEKRPPQIARELGVAGLIEGSVLREGDQVRITVQLIHAPTDRHLWAESYQRELRSILALQSDVARAIANEIRVKLSPRQETQLARSRPVNPEAYEAYLRGRYHWNKRTEEGLKRAVENFDLAIEKDPEFALAYSGLADAYAVQATYVMLPTEEGTLEAIEAAKKALQLDEGLAQGHASLGWGLYRAWDWRGAEREFKRALELDPSYETAHHWYALLLMTLGRFDEAYAEINKARELDPLSLIINANVCLIQYFARRYDEAIQQCQKTLELEPDFPNAHWYLGWAYQQKQMYEESLEHYQKLVNLSEDSPSSFHLTFLGQGYAAAGRRQEALKILRTLEERSRQSPLPEYQFALIYAELGQKDAAFRWLEKGYENRSVGLPQIKLDPKADSLRSDPRFQALLRRMNFPE